LHPAGRKHRPTGRFFNSAAPTARPICEPHGKLAFRSDFKTSRHYLAGVPQAPLPASLRPPQPGRSGVAAGFGTMNNKSPHIIIGEEPGRGDPQPFGIAAVDERQHLYIIGKTGSGKTTLLRNLILQHIALGHSVGVIDPHGDLAEELLNHIPPKRADHLVYFNPGDLEYPIGLNVIGSVAPDDRHLVASGIVAAFKGIWRDSWGPRLEYILYNAASALLESQNQTLLGVNRLLTDDHYREKVIRQVKDPFIRAFWAEEYANYDERFKRETIAPIQNKIGQFLLNPVVRNILGRSKKSGYSIRDGQWTTVHRQPVQEPAWTRQGEPARLTAGDAVSIGRDGSRQPAGIRTPGFLPVH
jgi:energy-coupling factor transporter ATP-binding protein EcfA2